MLTIYQRATLYALGILVEKAAAGNRFILAFAKVLDLAAMQGRFPDGDLHRVITEQQERLPR